MVPAAGTADLLVTREAAAALDRDAAGWPEIVLDGRALSDLELRLALPELATEPVRFPAPPGDAVPARTQLAVRDPEGVLLAVLTATATDAGVTTGDLLGVRLPVHPDVPELRRSPAGVAAELAARGWRRPAGIVTDRALFDADLDRIGKLLDSGHDGVVVALLAGGVEATDTAHHARLAALRAGLARWSDDRVLLLVLPLAADAPVEQRRRVAVGYGLPEEALHVEAAPGSPGDAAVVAALDGTTRADGVGPAEVLAALRRAHRPLAEQGFTVFFTGLSGSGKSTVAGLLAARLAELTERRVLLLDGDRVRRHLTAGLGFSREDRDTNVRRIGWAAAQVSAAGGVAVCAPIAPYDRTRREVRAMVEQASPVAGFVLVHIATPLEECERRDRKGLYARARSGALPAFTGISDPYEVPADAEVVADTTGRDPSDVVDQIVDQLTASGRLGATQA
ncbi:MAG: sulfate adenylyltransferase [Frankiaceae bacterium]|nr:sulfate adenylyltransferase [Frankiaceae bacterium]